VKGRGVAARGALGRSAAESCVLHDASILGDDNSLCYNTDSSQTRMFDQRGRYGVWTTLDDPRPHR